MDGTWVRCYHTSLYGVVAVNSIETGKVLHMHNCSKYCQRWEVSRKLPEDSEKYENWEALHKPECKVNYQCPSGGLEVDAAVKIFSSSEEEHGLRYTKSILETVTVKVTVLLLKQRCMLMSLLKT